MNSASGAGLKKKKKKVENAQGNKRGRKRAIQTNLRALAVVELNSYIAILATPKHQKEVGINGSILIFFSSIVIVHIYR